MAEQKQYLLSIRDLCIEAKSDDGWHEIVSHLDLDLRRGEVLGLIGESGAGKSTIGLAAMGHTRDGCRISHGSIMFDGVDLVRSSEQERRAIRGRRIAYVAQSAAASFNPAHRILDQCCETAVVSGANRKLTESDAIKLYRELRLPDAENIGFRYPHQLSGGQLQRAITAMAMICKPDLIIFDEPTTALDVTTQIEVLAAIRKVVRDHQTSAIYITHDLAVVAQMADRIKVLLHGREVEEAETRTMLSSPREEYTKSLWAVRNIDAKSRPLIADAEEMALQVQAITAGYGVVDVLKDVTFDIPRRRTVAVVGESGSGKSTLARVITGLLPPRHGKILVGGAELPPALKSRSKEDLRSTQLIYQMADTALNPKQRIREIIGRPAAFYRGLTGKALESRVDELLSAIELDPRLYRDRFPSELSGGQKQRIGIARAVAAEPSLIICDEVTSALDQLVAEGVLRLLRNLQEEFDISYMFITHDLATVRAIADAVVVMNNGKIVEQGAREAVFAPPFHPYTKKLISSVPEMDPDWLTNTLPTAGPNMG